MAKMDERLPLQDFSPRVIPDPAMPSAIGAAVDFATQALGGYVNLRNDMRQEAARKKKEDDEARQAQIAFEVSQSPERASEQVASVRQQFIANQQAQAEAETPVLNVGEATIDESGVFSMPVEVPSSLQREADVAARRAANFKAAEDQGRIPSITFNSAMNADFRRLRDKYPDQVEYILKKYKDFGLDAGLFTEAKDAQDEHEFQRELGQKRVTEAEARDEANIKSAEEAYGPEAVGWSRERKIIEGMKVNQNAFELKVTGEKIRIQKEKRELTDSERKAGLEELNTEFERKLITGSFNASQPFIQSMGRLVEALQTNPNDPQLIERFTNLGNTANTGIERYISSALAAATQEGYTGDLGSLEKTLRQQWQPIKDIFSGDHSVIKFKIDALKSIETSMKIDTSTALPLYTALTTAGFDVKNLPPIMDGLQSDPELMKALSEELKGYRQDILSDGGSTRFRRIIDILRGNDSLERAKPGALVKELPTLVNSTRNLAKQYVRAPKDTDGNLVINGVGEITTQLRGLPTNNTTVLAAATASFALPEHRQALINTLNDNNVDKGMAQATVQASRAGSALLLNYFDKNLAEINKTNTSFQVVWDKRDGKYKIDRSRINKTIADYKAGRVPDPTGSQFGPMTAIGTNVTIRNLQNAQVPDQMSKFIKSANLNLDNAIELGRHDPTTPKGTDVELRNWYGKQTPLPSMQQKKTQEINPEAELNQMFTKAEEALSQLREDVSSRRITDTSGLKGTIIEGEQGPKGYDSVYGDTANGNAHGLSTPRPVTQMTIGEAIDWGKNVAIPATRGKVGAGPDKGTSAVGAYQFVQSTLAKIAPEVFGSDWGNVVLTPENQDKLAEYLIRQAGGDTSKLISTWPSLRGKI